MAMNFLTGMETFWFVLHNTEMLIRLDFENNQIIRKEIIFENKIGRIRDFEIDKDGNIFLIVDGKETSLWKMTKVN